MKLILFNTKPYDEEFFTAANEEFGHEIAFAEPRLTAETAMLAQGFPAVCAFVNDVLDEKVLRQLSDGGVRLVALRSAGFNNVDLAAAERFGVTVARVPAYSPHAVAEHTVGLMLTLNRKLHRAYSRVREGNFSLNGLLGFDMHGRTAGVIGTGKIGAIVSRILQGFGCKILAYDVRENPEVGETGAQYVSLPEIYAGCDIITLHAPLVPDTYHMINDEAIAQMRRGMMLVNTSRGALIDTAAVIDGLKKGTIGSLAIDVYEEESDLFFDDLSDRVLHDDIFARLLTFPNVIATGHQAFFTREALEAIAHVTLSNVREFEEGKQCTNRLTGEMRVQKGS